MCAGTYACVCARACVIMAKLIDHQPVPICLVNIAQNHKQEEWDGKWQVSERVKMREGNERGGREGEMGTRVKTSYGEEGE